MTDDLANFDARLPDLEAIQTDDIKNSNMPIELYIQEAEDLYFWAKKDLPQLQQKGMTEAQLEELAIRSGVLREAESRWESEFTVRKEAQKQWGEQAEAGYQLRDNLLRDLRFALRKDPDGSKQVRLIAEGDGHADMIQDLASLSKLGKQHLNALAAINFDPALLDTAAERASQLAELLAQANGSRQEQRDGKITRDRAYTYLKEAVDDVRDYGKYVFYDNEKRLSGYSSAYHRRAYNRYTTEKNDETKQSDNN